MEEDGLFYNVRSRFEAVAELEYHRSHHIHSYVQEAWIFWTPGIASPLQIDLTQGRNTRELVVRPPETVRLALSELKRKTRACPSTGGNNGFIGTPRPLPASVG